MAKTMGWGNKRPARFRVFEDNGSRDHSKYWYLEAFSEGRSIMQIKSIMRSLKVKRSSIFHLYDIL